MAIFTRLLLEPKLGLNILLSFVPDASLPWLQPASRYFSRSSFSTPGTGGLSGSSCTLARAMESWAGQRGRDKVPALYNSEEEGRKITSVRIREQKVGQERVK